MVYWIGLSFAWLLPKTILSFHRNVASMCVNTIFRRMKFEPLHIICLLDNWKIPTLRWDKNSIECNVLTLNERDLKYIALQITRHVYFHSFFFVSLKNINFYVRFDFCFSRNFTAYEKQNKTKSDEDEFILCRKVGDLSVNIIVDQHHLAFE